MCIDQMGYDFCKNLYGDEEDSCEGDVEYCQCVEAIGEEACAEYYGEDDADSCDDGDDYCLCVEAMGEKFCAQFYGEE